MNSSSSECGAAELEADLPIVFAGPIGMVDIENSLVGHIPTTGLTPPNSPTGSLSDSVWNDDNYPMSRSSSATSVTAFLDECSSVSDCWGDMDLSTEKDFNPMREDRATSSRMSWLSTEEQNTNSPVTSDVSNASEGEQNNVDEEFQVQEASAHYVPPSAGNNHHSTNQLIRY